MRRVHDVIVVEGRYDKQAVLRAVDAIVVETSGFGLFKDNDKKAALSKLAHRHSLIVLTDSDGAGAVIRGHLKSFIPPEYIKQAFIPDLQGKERRKSAPSKEGKLGVEAMPPEVIIEALERGGAVFDNTPSLQRKTVTAADLYAWGLTGSPGSRKRKADLVHKLGLPEYISNKDLCKILSRYEDVHELILQNVGGRVQHDGIEKA
jgi:ribonuclease M5